MKWNVPVLMLSASLLWSAPALAEAPESNQESERNSVEGLAVEEQEDGTYIHIRGTEQATFSVFKLDEPPRLFVDLSNSELVDGELSKEVYNGVISEVGLVEFEDGFQDVARLVVGFEEPAHYDVRTEEGDVVVFVDGEHRQLGDDAVAAEHEEKLREREQQLRQAQARLDRAEEEYQQRVRERQQNYEDAVAELEQTQSELNETRSQLEQLRHERDEASGQERQRLEASIAEQSKELEATEQRLQQREQRVEQMQAAIDELEQERNQLKAERDEERRRYQQAQQRAEQAEQRAERAQQELAELEGRLGEMDSEVERAEQRLDEQRNELQEAQRRAERLEAELTEARRSAERQSDEVESEEAQRELQRLQQQRQQELAEAQARAEEAQQQVENTEQQRREWEEARREHQQKLQAAQQRAEQTEAELAEAQQTAEQARADAERAEAELAEAQQTAEQARADADRAEAENEELAEALAKRNEALQQRDELLSERDELLRERDRIIADRESTIEERESTIEERNAEIERLKETARTANPDAPEMMAVPVDPEEENAVRGVRLETDDDGRSRIVVDLDRPGQFTTADSAQNGQSVMVINDAELPEELERTLSAETDGGAVRFVSSYGEENGDVRMEADLRGDATEVIRQQGSSVVWEFAPEAAAETERTADATGSDRQPGDEANPQRPTEGDTVTSAPPQYPQVVTNPTQVTSVPGMGTEPITIDLRNADIDNVLRLISTESGVNIIAGDGVSGSVTMKLQGVPLDEAFLTILQSLGLGYELRGNVIRVAQQGVLQEEEEARAEARARAQMTEPLEVFMLPVNYASADEMVAQIEGLLSSRGSVSVDGRTNTLIIKDLADNLDSIRMLVETLDAQVPQVLIEARIVETNENFDREIGIQWGGDFSMSQGSGNPTGLIFPNVLGMSGGATDGQAPVEGTSENPNYAVNLPAPAGTGQGGAIGLTMGSVGGAVNLNMRLSAMEQAGYAKIISSPRIMTLDNRQATISQGTSIPISVVSAAGVQTIFVDATLELTVTPHVTPDGNVRMEIQATKNEPDFQNTGAQGDPTIIQNQAETELLVADGDTTVIGGIYNENTGESLSGVPFLHRIPILGALFQTHSETETRSELLIFITPRIVNRAEALGIGSTGTVDGIMTEDPAQMDF